ncbi:MAG TPA: hypothetical protein VFM07_03645 [Intrasporangium sp.]|nr:hypothetical protein [Intrasporangium sp.]
MSQSPADRRDLRAALRTELKQAMRDRNRHHVAAYRIALAAIDNAEAVPLGSEHHAKAIETSAVGVGASEVSRRELSHDDIHDLVRGEADELRAAADDVEPHDPAEAEVKRSQAGALDRLLRPAGSSAER